MKDNMFMRMIPIKLLMLAIIVSAFFFAIQGVNMHKEVAIQEDAFHELQTEYFSINKVEREAAASNSELTDQLVEIKNYPSELMELKLVGVGKMLTGIFIMLFGIMIALMIMPIRLKAAIKG